jgi:hypothetical protein
VHQKRLPVVRRQSRSNWFTQAPSKEARSDLLQLFIAILLPESGLTPLRRPMQRIANVGIEGERTSVSTFLLEARSALLPANAITKLGFPGKGHNDCMSGRLAQKSKPLCRATAIFWPRIRNYIMENARQRRLVPDTRLVPLTESSKGGGRKLFS